MKMNVYTSGVNGNDLRVKISTATPMIAGKTSSSQVNVSFGAIPDQISTQIKSKSKMEAYFMAYFIGIKKRSVR